MNKSNNFSLGEVLSVSTGKLLCEMGRLYDILNHMTGDNLYTHQLPRAMRECSPYIVRQYPQLAGVNTDDVTPDNWQAWLSKHVRALGDSFDISPIPAEDHDRINPIEELADMMGGTERIILVKP